MIARVRAWRQSQHECGWDADDVLSKMVAEALDLARLPKPQRRQEVARQLRRRPS